MRKSKKKYSYEFPRPSVTVDGVIFGVEASGLRILLIRRDGAPFQGCWALPGGFVQMTEDLEVAARRELQEETKMELAYLEQLYTFGKPSRDPRGRVISVSYLALVRPSEHAVEAGSDAREVRWSRLDELPSELAFDHREIIDMAVRRLLAKVRYAPIGFGLVPEEFALSELKALYEALLQRTLDKRNFLEKIQSTGLLLRTGKRSETNPPAELFRFNQDEYERLTRLGYNFEI